MLSGVVAHIGRVRDAILDRFAKEFNGDVAFHAFRGPLVISSTIVLVYLLSFSLRYVERSFWWLGSALVAAAVVEKWPLWRVRADHYFSGGMGMKILEIPGANLNGKKIFWSIWVYLERLSSFWKSLKMMFHSLLSKIQTGSFG